MSETATGDWLINTTDDNFAEVVFEGSKKRLVIVDFWADWCAPCRALGPVLEKLAEEYAGRFVLVKAETEQNQLAARQFNVSGIPAVFAVLDEKVVDSFQGAMPESALRPWIDKQLSGSKLLEAVALAKSNSKAAIEALRQLASESPNQADVQIALAELLLNDGQADESSVILQQLEKRGFLEPAAEKLKAMIELRGKASQSVEAARAKANATPKDYALQLDLAQVLAAHQAYEESFEICLNLVAVDRKVTGEQARALMVDVFRILPDDSELTREYRRKLSMALY